jgi:putative transposase
VVDGADQGERSDLEGGGLIRSQGGWEAVKALRRKNIRVMADERILGDSEFVERALRHAEESFLRRTRLKKRGYDIDRIAERAAAVFDVAAQKIYGGGK